MSRFYHYKRGGYVGKVICPRCGRPGYAQNGTLHKAPVLKVDHRKWDGKKLVYEGVCYVA